MNIWERHGFLAVPFVVFAAVLRRVAETMRLVYWRRFFGWEIGRGVRVHWTVFLPRKLSVNLGDGVSISRDVRVVTELPGGTLSIGANTSIDTCCLLDVTGELRIGENTTISESSAIFTHSHGRNPKNLPTAFPVSIGDDVWICSRAMILSSAKTIGESAIIGPYEVVRNPVPAKSIVMQKIE